MKNLTHRERVVRALKHEEPDRVPLDLGPGVQGMNETSYFNLKKYLNIPEGNEEIETDWFNVSKFDERILKYFDIDFRRVGLRMPENYKRKDYSDGTWSTEWGFRKRIVQHSAGRYGEVINVPLAEAESLIDIDNYSWPDAYVGNRIRGLKEEVEDLYQNSDYAIAGGLVAGPFETALKMRGFEQFFTDMLLNKKFVLALMERITNVIIGYYDIFLSAAGKYLTVIETSDDLGTQTGPMISLDLYRNIIKPYHRKIVNFIKSKTDAKIFFHSCGSVNNFIDDLADVGIDILNPVQPHAKNMDSV